MKDIAETLWTVFAFVVAWAALCGFNYDGQHYQISCDDKGVTVRP